MKPGSLVNDISRSIRFFLIGISMGVVDLVPGVSGGTLAFGYGLWERIINSVILVTSALRSIIKLDARKSYREFTSAEWQLLIPIGLGVVCAAFFGAAVIGSLLETHPQMVRAVFCGVVIGALPVPFGLINKWTIGRCMMVICATCISFLVSGIPSTEITGPSLLLIFFAASISICATILPGLSGSFLLLIFGLYEVLITAIRERDLATLGVFAAGACAGALIFTSAIAWLLRRHHDSTLAVLFGLMIGGLRVLWPWLGTDRELLFPDTYSEIAVVAFWLCVGLVTSIASYKLLASRGE